MKKIMVVNAVLALLFTLIFIFGQDFANTYPYSLTISNIISFYYTYDRVFILRTILLVVGGTFIISFISTQIGRKFNINLLKYTGTILFSVVIIFFSVGYFVEYLQVKQEYKERLDFYVNLAKEGIANDKIKIGYIGDFGPWIKEGKSDTVDSIMNQYGVVIWYDHSRTVYIQTNQKAMDTYLEMINAYLDKRNGKGWRERMDKELEPYIDRREDDF